MQADTPYEKLFRKVVDKQTVKEQILMKVGRSV